MIFGVFVESGSEESLFFDEFDEFGVIESDGFDVFKVFALDGFNEFNEFNDFVLDSPVVLSTGTIHFLDTLPRYAPSRGIGNSDLQRVISHDRHQIIF